MLTNVFIVYIEALCDFVIGDRRGHVSVAQEGNNRYGDGYSASFVERLIFRSNKFDDILEIAFSVVGFAGDHLKHPRAILEHQWIVEVFVFLRDILKA